MYETYQTVSHFSAPYAEHLTRDYGVETMASLEQDWRAAPLPLQTGEHVAYVRLGEQSANPALKPVLFVNGFAGGVVVNAPFAAAMAHHGFDIILPDQNHVSLPQKDGRPNATYGQAFSLAAIIANEKLEHTPLDVVSHSYGSLVFNALSQYAEAAGWTCFDGAKVAMLAPAGIKQDERLGSFLKRYISLLRPNPTIEKFPDGYWDCEGEMFEVNKQHVLANKRRTLHEAREIIWGRVDLAGIVARGIGEVALVPFAQDRLFSEDELAASIGALVQENITAFTPVSPQIDAKGLRSGRGADHGDHQFNPERVAGAVAQFLRS